MCVNIPLHSLLEVDDICVDRFLLIGRLVTVGLTKKEKVNPSSEYVLVLVGEK